MTRVTVQCPRIGGTINDFGAEHPAKYSAGDPLRLRQFWNGPDGLPSEAGVAYVGATKHGLSFFVSLQDSDIFSHATANDQKMWTLGDVVEFFVKPGHDRTDYWEIHVTPNCFLMDLHIRDRDQFLSGAVTWEQVNAPNSHATKRVAVMDGKWAVELSIPWSAFDLHAPPPPKSVWLFAVCRYNCTSGLEKPELSSTADLTKLNFHRYEEYSQLVF